jgi:disulfide oxidoreductase YuzD
MHSPEKTKIEIGNETLLELERKLKEKVLNEEFQYPLKANL